MKGLPCTCLCVAVLSTTPAWAAPPLVIVNAKVPCTSSQARTQRLQTMHFDGS